MRKQNESMQPVIQNTSEKTPDTLFLHVYYGIEASAYVYYEDDGITYNYEKGNSLTRTFRFDPAGNQIVIEMPEGSYTSRFSKIALMLHGFAEIKDKLNVNGQQAGVTTMTTDLLTTLSDKDPLNTGGRKFPQEVNRIMVENLKDKTIIAW